LHTLALHFGIELGLRFAQIRNKLHHPFRVHYAVLLSSFPKLLLVLFTIWDFNRLEHFWVIYILAFIANSIAISGTSSKA
jgi:hypothetical protein